MLQKFILNNMAKELTKHERDTLQVFQLWKDDQLIFYPDLPGRLSEWSLGALKNLEKKASRIVESGEPIYLVYDCSFAKLGLISIQANKVRGKMPFNLPYNICKLREDDILGRHYLEKVMSTVSFHYEDWEV